MASAKDDDLLFLPYETTMSLLSVSDGMQVCEDVFLMHARGSVFWPAPPTMILDTPAPFFNHWHVKCIFLADIPITGVRMFNFYNDGVRNNVGGLDSSRYILLTEPATGRGLALIDEHWSYALRTAASVVSSCKWLARPNPKVFGLVGVGTIATAVLMCMASRYKLEEIRCTSRSPVTREAFGKYWSERLRIPVIPKDSVRETVDGADVAAGCTTSNDVMARIDWLKPGSTFLSLARKELAPEDWKRMDKVVVDDWEANLKQSVFRQMVADGVFSKADLHAELPEIASGAKVARQSDQERILVHTTGLVSQDVAIAHLMYRRAIEQGLGIRLPTPSTGRMDFSRVR